MKKIFFLMAFFFMSSVLGAQTSVAVTEAAIPKDWDPVIGEVLNGKINESLLKVKSFKVLDRTNLQKVLQEKELSNTLLVTDKDAQTVAALIGAQFIVVPRGAKLGKTFYLAARMINAKTGEVAAQVSIEGQGDWEQVPGLAEKLAAKLGEVFGMTAASANLTTTIPSLQIKPYDIQKLKNQSPLTIKWKVPIYFPLFDRLVARFKEVNPQVKIEIETYNIYGSDVGSLIAKPQDADLVMAPADQVPIWAESGQAMEITSFLKKYTLHPLAMESSSYQGKAYSVPLFQGNHLFLYYNKTLSPTPPTYWEDILEKGKSGQSVLAFYPYSGYWCAALLPGYGSPFPTQLTGIPLVEADGAADLLDSLRGAIGKGIIDPKGKDPWETFTSEKELFFQGKKPYMISGDWDLDVASEKLKDKLAIAPLPKVKATGLPFRPMVSGYNLIPRKSLAAPKEAAVMAFLDYLLSEESQKEMMIWKRFLPSRDTPSLRALEESDSLMGPLRKSLENGMPIPMHPRTGKLWDALDKFFGGGLQSKQTSEFLAKELATTLGKGL